MAPKKIPGPKAQSPMVVQRAMIAKQKRIAKVSWKKSAMATECGRQRQLMMMLLPIKPCCAGSDVCL
jgi:hypothetical protein